MISSTKQHYVNKAKDDDQRKLVPCHLFVSQGDFSNLLECLGFKKFISISSFVWRLFYGDIKWCFDMDSCRFFFKNYYYGGTQVFHHNAGSYLQKLLSTCAAHNCVCTVLLGWENHTFGTCFHKYVCCSSEIRDTISMSHALYSVYFYKHVLFWNQETFLCSLLFCIYIAIIY